MMDFFIELSIFVIGFICGIYVTIKFHDKIILTIKLGQTTKLLKKFIDNRILTVNEFVETGNTEKMLIIECHDRNKDLICEHHGPAWNVEFEPTTEDKGILSWGDRNGDSVISNVSLSDKIEFLPDMFLCEKGSHFHTVKVK